MTASFIALFVETVLRGVLVGLAVAFVGLTVYFTGMLMLVSWALLLSV